MHRPIEFTHPIRLLTDCACAFVLQSTVAKSKSLHYTAPPSPPPSATATRGIELWNRQKDYWWDRGDTKPKVERDRAPWELEMDKNKIEYTEDPMLWHWAHRIRPVRCGLSTEWMTVTDFGKQDVQGFVWRDRGTT